jgi:tetratricopeptide (TPR) repeat protein
MRTLSALAVLGLLAGLVCAQGTTRPAGSTQPARAGNEQDILAAESFWLSAVGMTCSSADEPARAARLVVLSRWAEKLAGDDPRVQLLLADIAFAQANAGAETKALGQYLKAFPADHARWVRWISSSLSQASSAADRAGFLTSIVDRRDVPASVRAKAAALLAETRQGQGMADEAITAARTAIDLDPYGPDGLAVWIRLEGKSAAAGEVRVLLRSLQGNPRAAGQAWRLALELGKLGLHKEAVRFFDHALAADPAASKFADLPEVLQVQYGNALLDAGDAPKAVEVLDPACERHGRNTDLKCLLIEALQAAGKTAESEKRIDAMAAGYKAAGEPMAAPAAAEQAWFCVVTKPSPNLAVILAERAAKADPNQPLYQRILGAAELAAARTAKGEERLAKLRGTDVYACVFLAERFASLANTAECKKAILDGAALARSGPAWRRLLAVADKNKVTIPPAKGAEEAGRLAQGFDKTCLEMTLQPEKFLAVELKAQQQDVACGQGLVVRVALKNIGPVDIPLGEQGLLRPQMALSAMVGAENKVVARTTRLPMVIWPAPRYLRPNEVIQASVQVDVVELAAALKQRPLEDLGVLVVGSLDPQPKGGNSLPTVRIEPARLIRKGLLGDFNRVEAGQWVQAYRLALGRIVGDLKRGTLTERVLAARRTAALLAMTGEIQAGRAEPPTQLAASIDRRVILSMMRAILADPSPVVRQEMISSLIHLDLDPTAMGLLAPAVEDPAPMVRCRLVELLAVGKSPGYSTIVDLLAKDSDELVREMAKAFQAR